jgi:ribonuclease R
MSKKGKSRENSGIPKKILTEKILGVLNGNAGQALNYKQIAKRLNINEDSERRMISEILREITKQGLTQEVHQGKYMIKATRGYVTGTVDMTRMGYGFISTEDIEEDVFVTAKNLRTALHGDKVKVWLYAKRKGARPEGEVVEIMERSRSSFVGTMEIMPNFAFLIPDNKNMPFDIFIPLSKINDAKQGQKAVQKLLIGIRNRRTLSER